MKRILFLHGWSGSGEFWRPILQELRIEYDIYAPTLPGHAGEPSLKSLGIKNPQDLVEYLYNFYPSNFWEKTSLCGYSMGGRLAILLHSHIQKTLEIDLDLILFSTGLGCAEEEEQYLVRKQSIDWAQELSQNSKSFWNKWYEQEIFQGMGAAKKEEIIRNKSTHSNEHLAEALIKMAASEHGHLLPLLRAKGRFLYIAGSLDKKYAGLAQRIAKFCPESHLHIVEGSSHMVPVEKPRESAQLIRVWLEN